MGLTGRAALVVLLLHSRSASASNSAFTQFRCAEHEGAPLAPSALGRKVELVNSTIRWVYSDEGACRSMMSTLAAALSQPIPSPADPTATHAPHAGTPASLGTGFRIAVTVVHQDGKERSTSAEVQASNGGIVSLSDDGLSLVTDRAQWACSAGASISLGGNRSSRTIVVNTALRAEPWK